MYCPLCRTETSKAAEPTGLQTGDRIVVYPDGTIIKLEEEKSNMAMKGLISWSMGMPAIEISTMASKGEPTLMPARYVTLKVQAAVDSEAHRELLAFRDRLMGAFAPTGTAGE